MTYEQYLRHCKGTGAKALINMMLSCYLLIFQETKAVAADL